MKHFFDDLYQELPFQKSLLEEMTFVYNNSEDNKEEQITIMELIARHRLTKEKKPGTEVNKEAITTGEIKEMFLEIVDDTNDNVFNAQVLDVNNEPYIDLSKLELAEGQYSVNMVTLTSKYISSYKIYSKENNEQIITEDLKDDIKFSVVKNNSKNENAITENTTKNQIDNTVSKQKLPKAGKTTMVVAILVSILLSNILYICYKKYKRIN